LIILPDFTVLDPSLGWDPHKNRLASTFFDPNFVGAYFVISVAILLERIFPDKGIKNNSKVGFYNYFSLIIIVVGLILTFSRSAWGMLGIVVLFYGIFRSRLLLLIAFFTAFMAYFAIPRVQTRISGTTDPADSASLRIVSWGNTAKIIKDNFWTGIGFNTFRYAQEDYGFLTPDQDEMHSGAGSDSSLLFVFATTGVFGFLLYLSSFLFPLYDVWRKRYLGWLVIISVLIGLLMESQFINSLFYPQIMFILYSLLFTVPSHT
jgi:O-antigen ligase